MKTRRRGSSATSSEVAGKNAFLEEERIVSSTRNRNGPDSFYRPVPRGSNNSRSRNSRKCSFPDLHRTICEVGISTGGGSVCEPVGESIATRIEGIVDSVHSGSPECRSTRDFDVGLRLRSNTNREHRSSGAEK